MTKAKDWKRITIYVLPEEHQRIRINSFHKNTSTSEYVRSIVINGINKEDPEESNK